MIGRLLVAAALSLAPVPLRAAAPADENARDMRCLIVSFDLASAKNKELETAGLLASQYFLGRLDGRSPGGDFEALLVREAERMTEAEKAGLMTTCLKQIEDRNKLLEAVGNKLAGTK
jgi:hypothetical protein